MGVLNMRNLRGALRGVVLLGAVLLGGLLTSCDDGKVNVFSLKDDKALGKNLSLEIAGNPSEYPPLDRAQYGFVYDKLESIRDAILASGEVEHASDFAWEVKVLDSPTLNAFCAPGGYIYFYTGLLKYLDNEAQVAGVMGHEMGHAAKRHSTHQMTKKYGLDFVLQMVTGVAKAKLGGIAAELAGKGAQVGGQLAVLKFSRTDETEADECSVRYLSKTQYDPHGVAGFFRKMRAEGSGAKQPEFLSTHPSHANRIENIDKMCDELGVTGGETFESEYKVFKSRIP